MPQDKLDLQKYCEENGITARSVMREVYGDNKTPYKRPKSKRKKEEERLTELQKKSQKRWGTHTLRKK